MAIFTNAYIPENVPRDHHKSKLHNGFAYQSRPIDAQSRPGSDPDGAQWPRGSLIRPVGQSRGCRRTPKSANWTQKQPKLDPKGHHHNPKEDQRYTQRITICPKSSERCPKGRPKAPRTRKGRPQNAETKKKSRIAREWRRCYARSPQHSDVSEPQKKLSKTYVFSYPS